MFETIYIFEAGAFYNRLYDMGLFLILERRTEIYISTYYVFEI